MQTAKRLVRWALPLIAVALLVTGLAGPIERAWKAREANRASTMLAERIANDRAAIETDFRANRVRILAEPVLPEFRVPVASLFQLPVAAQA